MLLLSPHEFELLVQKVHVTTGVTFWETGNQSAQISNMAGNMAGNAFGDRV